MIKIRKRYVAAAAVVAALMAGTGAAVAATTASTALVPHAGYACTNLSVHQSMTMLNSPSRSCPSGTTSIVIGAQGPAGRTGPQGPSGVVSEKADDLGGVSSVPTGGPFVANSTEVGSGVPLAAGTYLISLDAKATPRASGDTAQIFPQFFLYDQPKNAAFTGDDLNVGAGALEPDGTNHDSYFSGDTIVTLSAPTTMHIYAFGYDSDQGSGAYALDDLAVTVVQVTPAS